MRVAVAGASGLIGSSLIPALAAAGHQPVAMVRSPPEPGSPNIAWDPSNNEINTAAFDGIDAVINLAGRGVATARWSEQQKLEILESRVKGNQLIARMINAADDGPKVFIAGSAIGFYGDTGDTLTGEATPAGNDFLADVCRSLEEAASAATDSDCRVVTARTGIVLSKKGGALAQLLPFFRLGIGGRIGRGDQYWSWISLDDEVTALIHLLDTDIAGPVNLTAPGSVTNAEFTRTLAKVLNRPAFLPTPKPALWARLGRELTEALLYTSARIDPAVLSADGFQFTHPDLESALHAILDPPATEPTDSGDDK